MKNLQKNKILTGCSTKVNSLLSKLPGCEQVRAEVFIRANDEVQQPSVVDTAMNNDTRHLRLLLSYDLGLEESLYFDWDENNGLICRRLIRNHSAAIIQLQELGLLLQGIRLTGASADDYFYHTENPRIYGRMAIPVRLKRSQGMVQDSGYDTLAGNKWADPGVVSERIGASPYQPFPAVLLSNRNIHDGLVHGSLSQRFFYHNYTFAHRDDGIAWNIFSNFKNVAYRELQPGEILEDHWYLGATAAAHDLEAIFSNYTAVLRQHLPPLYGATTINRHSLVWGSWNDGINRDIDEARLLEMAEFLHRELPTVEWMQIDDGYAENAGKLKLAHGLGMPYEDDGVDRTKFPHGLKHFTDKVREKGIRPAVWIGGAVPAKAPLVQDHPDWFFDYSYRFDVKRVLDVSKPEVRQYMERALDFFFRESAFEGMKHDFWSYAFEDSHDLLANKTASGYEWRTWWLRQVRERLPRDGYLQTGCDIVMGNPFLAEKFTNYRYGIDIGSGKWDHLVTNLQWGAACFALHIGDLFVPNSDSIGLFPGLTDAEALFCINYCLISRSMVEVAGWLYQEPDHPRLKWVKKACCCPNNGQHVYFCDYDYRNDSVVGPAVWYLKSPHFARIMGHNPHLPWRTVAVFNIEEHEQEFTLKVEKLGLEPGTYTFTDVWSQACFEAADMKKITVPAHGSCLLAVSRKTADAQLLDANIEIAMAQEERGTLTLQTTYAAEAELLLNQEPREVLFDGSKIKSVVQEKGSNCLLQLQLPAAGVLALSF